MKIVDFFSSKIYGKIVEAGAGTGAEAEIFLQARAGAAQKFTGSATLFNPS
jgi:hypothetical protein